MTIDQAKLGQVTTRLMDLLGSQHGEDAELGTILIIAAVDHDNGTQTTVHNVSSDNVAIHEALGLLQIVQNHVAKQI